MPKHKYEDPPEDYERPFEGVFIAAAAWEAWERGEISADNLMLLHQLRTYEGKDGFTKSTTWLVENCGMANHTDSMEAVKTVTERLEWLKANGFITIEGGVSPEGIACRKIKSLRKIDNVW